MGGGGHPYLIKHPFKQGPYGSSPLGASPLLPSEHGEEKVPFDIPLAPRSAVSVAARAPRVAGCSKSEAEGGKKKEKNQITQQRRRCNPSSVSDGYLDSNVLKNNTEEQLRSMQIPIDGEVDRAKTWDV